MVKNRPQCRRPGFGPWVGKIPWRRACQPTPVFLPENPHGQRRPASYSPWGRKESDMTKRLSSPSTPWSDWESSERGPGISIRKFSKWHMLNFEMHFCRGSLTMHLRSFKRKPRHLPWNQILLPLSHGGLRSLSEDHELCQHNCLSLNAWEGTSTRLIKFYNPVVVGEDLGGIRETERERGREEKKKGGR